MDRPGGVLLTVVTVVRNDPAGLAASLASLAAQDTPPGQVVVLDGSDDREAVPALLATFPGLPLEYSWSWPQGVYAAMNAGLAEARGTYVYFLNAGDLLAGPTVLSTVCSALAESSELWAIGEVAFLAADGSRMPEPAWSYDDERARLFARGRFPAHQGVVVRTEALRDQGGFDLSFAVAADYLSILRLAAQERPIELDIPLAVFSVGGLSSQRWRTALAEFHRARRLVFAPSGTAAALEWADTARARVAAEAYRGLWAPGRPLSGLVARIRPTPGR